VCVCLCKCGYARMGVCALSVCVSSGVASLKKVGMYNFFFDEDFLTDNSLRKLNIMMS